MKFLCIACDEPMTLTRAAPPDRGSITAVFRCPSCSAAVAMLTNPMETELVRSLGVKIGPATESAAAAAAQPGSVPAAAGATKGQPTTAAERAEAGGCPFAGMVAAMESGVADGVGWTAEALARLEAIPELVRPMARQGVEHYARTNGHTLVDARVLAEARERFGM
jgi:hypothetical protein